MPLRLTQPVGARNSRRDRIKKAGHYRITLTDRIVGLQGEIRQLILARTPERHIHLNPPKHILRLSGGVDHRLGAP